MFKKSIIILATIIVTSNASEFLKYNRAFRVVPSFTTISNDWIGFSLGLNYEQKVGNSIIEFNLTPKFLTDSYSSDYTYDILSDNSKPSEDDYYINYSRTNLQLAVLFSHRPAIITKNGPGAFTFNAWRYGVLLEMGLLEKRASDNDLVVTEESVANFKHKYIGLIYKPSVGIQLNRRLNLGVELMYSYTHDIEDSLYPSLHFGTGFSLTVSSPIENF